MARIRGSATKIRAIVKLSPLLAFSSVSVYAVASVSEERVVAAANYQQNIQAAVNIIPSTKLENEVVNPAEFVAISTDRLLIDIATASEDIAIGVELDTSDTVNTADADTKESNKVIADSAVGVDVFAQTVEKPLFSFANSSDDSSLDVTISKIETLVPVDTIDAFAVEKSLSDSATVFDALTAVQADKILEVFVVADAVKVRDVGKVLADVVVAAEDTTWTLSTPRIDSATPIDSFAYEISKDFADSSTADDSAYAVNVNTPRESSVSADDLPTTAVGKSVTDTLNVVDQPVFSVATVYTEQAIPADQVALIVDTSAIDTTTAVDAATLDTGLSLIDTAVGTDTAPTFVISPVYVDTAVVVDTPAKTISTSATDASSAVDQISKTVFRSVTSSVGVFDTVTRSIGINIFNTVVAVEDIEVTEDTLNVIIGSSVTIGDGDPIIYNVRTQSDSFMFAGYELNGNQLN